MARAIWNGAISLRLVNVPVRDALCAIIRAKRAGKEVHHAPETEEAAKMSKDELIEALSAAA